MGGYRFIRNFLRFESSRENGSVDLFAYLLETYRHSEVQ